MYNFIIHYCIYVQCVLSLHYQNDTKVNFEIVEITALSGSEATIYTIIEQGEECSYFEQFLQENSLEYEEELKNILTTIEIMSNRKGVAEFLLKNHEGGIGDGIIALFDNPEHHLRLYGIRFGSGILILGGGGFKSKDIRAWQEDEKLSSEVEKLKYISKKITERIKDREITFSDNDLEIEGNLIFTEYE